MKKYYPFFFTALFLAGTCFSTVTAQFVVKPGFRAGANLSALMGDYNESGSTGFVLGPQLGVTSQFNFNDEAKISFLIQPELLFTGRGGKSYDVTTRLNYLELPIMVGVHFGSFYLEAGPQLGYLLSARANSPEGKTNVKESYKPFDFSITEELGWRFDNGFGFGLRATSGISPVQKENTYEYYGSTTHIGIGAALTYTFSNGGYDY